MRQLVQHVAGSRDLPPLDPPIYGLPTLALAQRWLRGQELRVAALTEAEITCPTPRLATLLAYLGQPCPLTEQVVQTWRWDLLGSPPLPVGLPRE